MLGYVHVPLNVTRDGQQYTFGVIEIPSFYLNYRARRAGTEYRSVSEDTNNALKTLAAKNVQGLLSIYVITQVVHLKKWLVCLGR
jgi:hypothetical protein